MVQDTIERHLPQEQFAILKAAEESERELLKSFVDRAELDDDVEWSTEEDEEDGDE
jgi:hypothetical protein